MPNTTKSLDNFYINNIKDVINNSDLPLLTESEEVALRKEASKIFKTDDPTYEQLKAASFYGEEVEILSSMKFVKSD